METLTKIEQNDNRQDTTYAAIMHLSALSSYIGVPFGSILGPLITWLIWRNESSFVDENGKEALNFNLSLMLYQIVAVILIFIFSIGSIVGLASTPEPEILPLILALPAFWLFIGFISLVSIIRLVLVIIAAVKASNGEIFRYPLTIRIIK